MRGRLKTVAMLLLLSIIMLPYAANAVVVTEEKTGAYVKAADYVIYADLFISGISDADVVTGKLKVIENLKGDPGKTEIDVKIDMLAPIQYRKFKSDLTNLNISASEDIEHLGSSQKRVVAMLAKAGDGYEFLRLITFFRPDKYEMYLYSYKEIVSMTKITDSEKLKKTIKYNLGEEFTYSLYSYCIDELFKLDISFAELFSIVKEFLDFKGNRKTHSWFKVLKDTAKRFEKDYDNVDVKARDEFFLYLYNSFSNEPIDNEYVNRQFLVLLYDIRRLILRDPEWKKKYHDSVKAREIIIESLNEDHFRNKKLADLRKKVMRSLSKE